MESWESFEVNQRVIDDFSSRTLAVIPNDVARLIHIVMLRDLASGRYRHEGLEELYSSGAVDQALRYCHVQAFEKILESSLERQDLELRHCLEKMEGEPSEIASRWLELGIYRLLMPLGMPECLRDVFCSNLEALLGLIVEESTKVPSTA